MSSMSRLRPLLSWPPASMLVPVFGRENTFCHASHASHRTGVRVVTDDSTVPEGFSWEIGSVDEAMLEAFRHLVTGRDLQI